MTGKNKRAFGHFIRTLFRRSEMEDELAEEIQLHIEELAEEYQNQGMTSEEAYKAARVRFGGVERVREECRDHWGIRTVSNFWRDIKFSVRVLSKSSSFAAITIATLAIGIGLNTSMFSMLNGLLLKPLDYPESDRMFKLYRSTQDQPLGQHALANFRDIAREGSEVADLAGYIYWGFTVSDGENPPDMFGSLRVSTNYFDVLGIHPKGRGFDPSEDAFGKNNVIVVSYRFWRIQLKEDPNAIGSVITVDGQPTQIVGIMPQSNDTPRVFPNVSIFRPIGANSEEAMERTLLNVEIVGRYRNGVSPKNAQAQLDTIANRLGKDFPAENTDTALAIKSLQSTTLSSEDRSLTYLLLGLAAFVLLIACSNLANIILARAIGRAREFTIRAALGASRGQLIRILFAECLILAAGGGALALLLSIWITKWLAINFGNAADPDAFPMDIRVLAFAALASILTAFVFGLAPALWAARLNINETLKTGSRGATSSRIQNRYRQMLIIGQFALALVLLAGSGLFIRGLNRITQIKDGWDPSAVLSGNLSLPSDRYDSSEAVINFHHQLRAKLLEIPGVENATISYATPLFGSSSQRAFVVQGRDNQASKQGFAAKTNGVFEDYFDTVGTKLIQGRLFDQREQLTSKRVVIINQSMAKSLFPGEDAIGKIIGEAGKEAATWAEIVGIVEDTRPMQLEHATVNFEVYKPYVHEAWSYVAVVVRAVSPAIGQSLGETIRDLIVSQDPQMPVSPIQFIPDQIRNSMGNLSIIGNLLLAFAGLGLLLAALGIYGVITRLVVQRTGEIGIRMALGAKAKEIAWMIFNNVAQIVLVGTVVGLVGAFALQRVLGSQMPAMAENAVLPIVAATLILFLVSLLACHIPVKRATRISPTAALASE